MCIAFKLQDTCGFSAGDTNLYRYVENGPTNATDPSGLRKFVVQGNKLVLQVELIVNLEAEIKVEGGREVIVDWWNGPERIKEAEKLLKQRIEEIWNNQPFILRPIDEARKKAPDDRKIGLIPTVDIEVVQKAKDKSKDGWVVTIYADKKQPRTENDHEQGGKLFLSEYKLYNQEKDREFEPKQGPKLLFSHYPAPHEFGHLLGLNHPGHIYKGSGQDEYRVDPDSLMGLSTAMRGWYFGLWIDYLNTTPKYRGSAPWVAQLDVKHSLYQSTLKSYRHIVDDGQALNSLPLEFNKEWREARAWSFLYGGGINPRQTKP